MPQRGPHISLAPERLVKRVLGIPLEEFQTWPEYLQELALSLAEELFMIRYNPFIPAENVRASVMDRLKREKGALSPEYFHDLSTCLQGYWDRFEQDRQFTNKLLKRMASILPKEQISTSPHTLVECSTDATDLRMELPAMVVFPETTEQIQKIVRLANELGFAIVPRGGGSGLTGGAVPAKWRTVVLSMTRFNKILSVDTEKKRICAQTGVLTLHAGQEAAKHGMLFTVDPASKAASSLGGNLSENAGGPFAFEYGTTIDNVVSYTMVTPSGECIKVRRKNHPGHKIFPHETAIFEILDERGDVKETISLRGDKIRAAGLGKDVTNKFLGGLPGIQKEGVDGIITEACFTLHPQQDHFRVLCLEFFGSSMRNASLVIQSVVELRDTIRNEGDKVKISAMEEFGTKYVQAIEYQKKSSTFEGAPISVLIIQLDSDDESALDKAMQEIVDIADPFDNVDIFVARDEKEAERFWHDRHQLSAISKRTSGFKINEDVVLPLAGIPEFSDFIEATNLHYLARAYRKALQQVTGLDGVEVDDAFIQMELGVTTDILKGKTTTADISEQELELQVFYFFQHLKNKYVQLQDKLDRIFEDMTGTRIIVANHMHAGDGNCHVNLPVNSNDPEMLALAEEAVVKVTHKVLELGGVVSGEHGIGITKIPFLQEEKIIALKGYKRKVDPNNVFNPGKLTQRELVVLPYTFSFNRLIKDINKTAIPGKDRLISLLVNIQTCTRCGKCKQVCPMFQPEAGLLFHPRNKNIALGALIEAIYYSQLHTGEPDKKLLDQLRQIMDHCTACGKCTAVCPVKIHTSEVTLHMRAYLDEKGAGGHPFKTRVLDLLSKNPQKTLPVAARVASMGQAVQNKVVTRIPETWKQRMANPLFTGKGPQMEFTNLTRELGLKKGAIFLPRDPSSGPVETVFYFPGCGAGLFYPSIAIAGTYLLLKAGVGVALPPVHLCCGYPLLAAGHKEAYQKMGRENREIIYKALTLLADLGHTCSTFLTSCGTCREGTQEYRLRQGEGPTMDHLDVVQFLLERLQPADGTRKQEDLVYHAACHPEWTGMDPVKAGNIYAQTLAQKTGCTVRMSPGCCGESGMGAMTSPAIYNKIRSKKQHQLNQDLKGYPKDGPVIVGCPSCKIGIKRSLIQMHRENEVLHTLEYLAQRHGGKQWKKEFLKTLGRSKTTNGVRILQP
jgi:FAD/FMN-containing dehydrogenase/Fe-S oxidoreductase